MGITLAPHKSNRQSFRIALLTVLLILFSCSAQACPDFTQNGQSLSYTSDELYTAKVHKITAGGTVDLGSCLTLPGQGMVTIAPDFTLAFSANSGRAIEFRVDSECDSIILINDASGNWHYDDDSNGSLDAKLRLVKAANGTYDIWVGTRYAGTCSASLTIETF